jgi:hypothetical protein
VTEGTKEQGRGDGGISYRTAAWLAWSLATATLALVTAAIVLGVANRPEVALYRIWLTLTLISVIFAIFGALIVSSRPGNVIGWIFLTLGVGFGVQLFSGQYATVALLSEKLSLGAVAAWLSSLVQISAVQSFLFLILLFPTGRLPSSRWRPVMWIAGTAIVASVISHALSPGPIEGFASVKNPFGVEAAAVVLDILSRIGGWTAIACFVAAILSLVLRFYRSRGDERLQLKWFVYATTLGFLAIVITALSGDADRIFGDLAWTLGPLSLPLSAGIAIFKYRLYDIDVIINRTLVYGILTATLVALYFSGIVVLQRLFVILTGEQSTLAVVASTLLIAALFNPLRRRIQSFIDRHFYRRKYDARKTLETFSARLREETDLGTLADDLVVVVGETMQPAHVSLWLRPERASEAKRAH